MFRGEVRVATHHLLRFPTTELLEREERRPALHVPLQVRRQFAQQRPPHESQRGP